MADGDKKLKILTKDSPVEIEAKYANYSEVIKGCSEDLDEEIPINVSSQVFNKAMEFCIKVNDELEKPMILQPLANGDFNQAF